MSESVEGVLSELPKFKLLFHLKKESPTQILKINALYLNLANIVLNGRVLLFVVMLQEMQSTPTLPSGQKNAKRRSLKVRSAFYNLLNTYCKIVKSSHFFV